jgi:hypothetical protein
MSNLLSCKGKRNTMLISYLYKKWLLCEKNTCHRYHNSVEYMYTLFKIF